MTTEICTFCRRRTSYSKTTILAKQATIVLPPVQKGEWRRLNSLIKGNSLVSATLSDDNS